MDRRETVQHPSYAMVRVSRVNSGKQDYFFGSDVIPPAYIEFTVSPGEVEMDMGRNWYGRSHTKEYIRFKMTPVQFSELITSMNHGDGIPCTLEYVNGAKVLQQDNKETKIQFNKRKIKEMFTNLYERVLRAKTKTDLLNSSKPLVKEDREAIMGAIYGIEQDLRSNLNFYLEQFNIEMDNIALDVKSNLEASIMQKITQLGIQEFKKLYQELGDGSFNQETNE